MKWLQERLPGNAGKRDGCQCQGTSGAPPHATVVPAPASSCLTKPLKCNFKTSKNVSHRLENGKLSLPKPSGRGLRFLGAGAESAGRGRQAGRVACCRVVRSTFSASMRVYFTAKAFTNEWMSASKTAKQAVRPPPSPGTQHLFPLLQPTAPTFTSASSGIRLRAAAFCWAFVFSASS